MCSLLYEICASAQHTAVRSQWFAESLIAGELYRDLLNLLSLLITGTLSINQWVMLVSGHSDLMSTRPTYDPYLDNLKSPLIKDESDGKTLRLRLVEVLSAVEFNNCVA